MDVVAVTLALGGLTLLVLFIINGITALRTRQLNEFKTKVLKFKALGKLGAGYFVAIALFLLVMVYFVPIHKFETLEENLIIPKGKYHAVYINYIGQDSETFEIYTYPKDKKVPFDRFTKWTQIGPDQTAALDEVDFMKRMTGNNSRDKLNQILPLHEGDYYYVKDDESNMSYSLAIYKPNENKIYYITSKF
jgi:hypothetical protein